MVLICKITIKVVHPHRTRDPSSKPTKKMTDSTCNHTWEEELNKISVASPLSKIRKNLTWMLTEKVVLSHNNSSRHTNKIIHTTRTKINNNIIIITMIIPNNSTTTITTNTIRIRTRTTIINNMITTRVRISRIMITLTTKITLMINNTIKTKTMIRTPLKIKTTTTTTTTIITKVIQTRIKTTTKTNNNKTLSIMKHWPISCLIRACKQSINTQLKKITTNMPLKKIMTMLNLNVHKKIMTKLMQVEYIWIKKLMKITLTRWKSLRMLVVLHTLAWRISEYGVLASMMTLRSLLSEWCLC